MFLEFVISIDVSINEVCYLISTYLQDICDFILIS